jgi:hypothetical protein
MRTLHTDGLDDGWWLVQRHFPYAPDAGDPVDALRAITTGGVMSAFVISPQSEGG